MFPEIIQSGSPPPPACVLPVLDEQLVFAGSPTIVTGDNLTFDITNFTGVIPAPFPSWIFLKSSVDLLALGNFNDWITENLIINSTSPNNPLGLSVQLGFCNELVDFTNPATLANCIFLSAEHTSAIPPQLDVRFASQFDSLRQQLAIYNDLTLFSWAGSTFTCSTNRALSSFQGSLALNGAGIPAHGYADIISALGGTELYPIVLIQNNNVGTSLDINLTFRPTANNFDFSKAQTASACGSASNTGGLAANSIKVPKTGQTVNYTPPGRTSGDDGQVQEGRLNKNSPLYDPTIVFISAANGTTYAGTKDNASYSGNTTINFGDQSFNCENAVTYISEIGLMFNFGALNKGLNFAFDDSGGLDNDIFAYCDSANSAMLSGHNDWRVANFFEIINIMKLDENVSANWSYPDWNNFLGNGYSQLVQTILTSTTVPNVTTSCFSLISNCLIANNNKTTVTNDQAPVLVRNLTIDSI